MKSITKFLGWWKSGKEIVISAHLVRIIKLFGLALALVVGVFIFFYWVSPVPQAIENAGALKDPYKYTDEDGKQYAQIESDATDKQTLDALKDSLKLALKKNGSPFHFTQTIYKTDTVIRQVPVYVYIDTNTGRKKFKIEHKDKFVYLMAEGDDSVGSFKLETTDSITIALSRKKRLFRPDEITATAINSSPYAKPVAMRSVTLKERTPLLSFGPQVGIGFSNGKLAPYLGVGATMPILTIKKRK